jgi:hypothetical protein
VNSVIVGTRVTESVAKISCSRLKTARLQLSSQNISCHARVSTSQPFYASGGRRGSQV